MNGEDGEGEEELVLDSVSEYGGSAIAAKRKEWKTFLGVGIIILRRERVRFLTISGKLNFSVDHYCVSQKTERENGCVYVSMKKLGE